MRGERGNERVWKKLTGAAAGGSRNGNKSVSGLNWPLKFRSMVILLNLRNAVQSAKSVLPDVKNNLLEFGSLPD